MTGRIAAIVRLAEHGEYSGYNDSSGQSAVLRPIQMVQKLMAPNGVIQERD